MDGGRSLLGAKGRGIGTAAKAAVDTGLTRPFPSIREARLAKNVLARYPDYAAVRFYRDEARALAAAAARTPTLSALRVVRPFEEHFLAPMFIAADGRSVDIPAEAMLGVAMLLLPCPAAFSPAVLLFKDAGAAQAASDDLVPPLALACAHRALFELDRFAVDYSEAFWKKTDRRLRPYFDRRGPFLYPHADAGTKDYDRLFKAALGAGVLLSPYAELPSIIPGDFDDGELALLAKALEGP
jgi:hypothetical protein